MATSTVTADHLRDIADRIVDALNRNTAAQLTVAMMTERQNMENTGDMADYIKDTVLGAFYAMLDSSRP